MEETLTLKELIRLWGKFCGYIVENNPHYSDSDFTFDNFIAYLQMKGESINN